MKLMFRFAGVILMIAGILLLLPSCKRPQINDLTPNPINNPTPVNDGVSVSANVFGVVVDENNQPIVGAVVKSGQANTITNANGGFYFNNINLSKENGSVSITKPGYFMAVRSFKTSAGKDHIVRIQMMQRRLSGTLQSSLGGTVSINAGASIIFPPSAFVSATGVPYNGTVKIFARALDPLAPNLPLIIPGDLRGIDSTGAEALLKTFGMIGAELEDASGNVLNIAPGKTADISFPIAPALMNTAPDNIPLWHFDNITARWKQEGKGSKINGKYVAQVNKFSFWNFDLGQTNLVNIDFTLLSNGVPLVGALVKISVAATGFYKVSNTNSTGFTDGLVPSNTPLMLEVISPECSTPAFSMPIGPFSVNTSLGNIAVNVPLTKYINFTGNIKNCTGAAVTNGSISLYGSGGQLGFALTNALGNFSFNVMNCSAAAVNYIYAGTDNATNIQGAIQSGSATSGIVNLGTITACGAPQTANIYIAGFSPSTSSSSNAVTMWKNGVASVFTDGSRNGIGKTVYVFGSDVYVLGTEQNMTTGIVNAKAWKNGLLLYSFGSASIQAQATDLVVSGGDVYISGYLISTPTIWKNGVATTLQGTGGPASLAVSGIDVYAAGTDNGNGVIWKNGVKILTTNSGITEFVSIFISGTDVYVGGRTYNGNNHIATIWKNGLVTALTNGTSDAGISNIFIAGSDVYAVGGNVLWKNGVATFLSDGVAAVGLADLQIVGNDVYVVGTKRVQGPVGLNEVIILWKNNLPTDVTNGSISSSPVSLFVN